MFVATTKDSGGEGAVVTPPVVEVSAVADKEVGDRVLTMQSCMAEDNTASSADLLAQLTKTWELAHKKEYIISIGHSIYDLCEV